MKKFSARYSEDDDQYTITADQCVDGHMKLTHEEFDHLISLLLAVRVNQKNDGVYIHGSLGQLMSLEDAPERLYLFGFLGEYLKYTQLDRRYFPYVREDLCGKISKIKEMNHDKE